MIARNLTIASLVCGGLGSLMFLGYKASGAEKNSFVGHSSKFLIAVGVFLLAVAVLDLTKENYFDEGYESVEVVDPNLSGSDYDAEYEEEESYCGC